jgi:pyridoxamine-phosphate oxidase
MLRDEISKLRQNYTHATLHENEASADPIMQFDAWFAEAGRAEIYEYNAMTLATCHNNKPDARIVLLKSFDQNGFVFFTNYDSQKGKELKENPQAALVFLWKDIERQVRIRGTVSKVEKKMSEDYFYSRPMDSQLGAVASQQSEEIDSRESLDKQFIEAKEAIEKNKPKMPENWGGYIVAPNEIEFWQGRVGRMHDRLLYTKEEQNWKITRLQP